MTILQKHLECMFTLVSERIIQAHLQYLLEAQKFLIGKQGLHLEGLTSKKTVFTVVMLLQAEKRKLRNHAISLVRNMRLLKQSIKLSLTRKMMSGPLKLKDTLLLWMTYMLKIQCSSNFQLMRLIQIKALYIKKTWKTYNFRQRNNVSQNRWTYWVSLRWAVWYCNSEENDGRKVVW